MKRMTIEIKEKRRLSLKKNGLDGPCCCVQSSPSFRSGVVGLYSDRRLTKSRHVSFQQSVGIRITGLKMAHTVTQYIQQLVRRQHQNSPLGYTI